MKRQSNTMTGGVSLILVALVFSLGSGASAQELQSFPLDLERIVVFVDAEGAPIASAEDAIECGLASTTKWGSSGAFLLHFASPAQDRAALIERGRTLASRRGWRFFGPVFRDGHGRPLAATPWALVGRKKSCAAVSAEERIAARFPGRIVDRDFAGFGGLYRLEASTADGFAVMAALDELRREPGFSFAETDVIGCAEPCVAPNDPLYSVQQSAFGLLEAEAAWTSTRGAPSVRILVIDDGVQTLSGGPGQYVHIDLPEVTAGYRMTTFSPNNGFAGHPVTPYDNHGTEVFGCIAAKWSNGIGVAGLAPDCSFAIARAFEQTLDTSVVPNVVVALFQESGLVAAMSFGRQRGCRITNMSYSLPLGLSALALAYATTRAENNMIHFAPTGNSGAGVVAFPASLPDVMAVGACSASGGVLSISNTGADVEFVAPGDSITTTDRTGANGGDPGNYITVTGTSFSSAFAAAVAGLVLSVSDLPGAAVEDLLRSAAIDLGTAGHDPIFGHGRLSAKRALELARGVAPEPPLTAFSAFDATLGDPTGAHAGTAVAVIGDVDGDGKEDVAIGAPGHAVAALGTDTGRVTLQSGATGAILLTLFGTAAGERFGQALARVGDQNGDGIADLAIGAPRSSPGGLSAAGRVTMISGADGTVLWNTAGTVAFGAFGWSLHRIVENPNIPADLLVGAPTDGSGSASAGGTVSRLGGGNGTVQWTSLPYGSPADRFGFSVSDFPASELTTQHIDVGVIVGAPGALGSSGQVVPLDPTSGALQPVLQVGNPGDELGYAIAWRRNERDMPQGAYLFGAPGHSPGGSVYAANGGPSLTIVVLPPPEYVGSRFGASVAVRKNRNFDRVDHIAVIGAPLADATTSGTPTATGAVFLEFGTSSSRTILGTEPGGRFGAALESIDDISGDGFSDFVAGAPDAPDVHGFAGAGRVGIYSGRGRPRLHSSAGTANGDGLGDAVAGVGDVDGDGYDDTAVGASGSDAGGLDAGAAAIISGLTGQVIFSHNGVAAGDRFGASVSGIGDLNGDGKNEYIVGAPFATVAGQDRGRVYVYSGATGLPMFVFDGSVNQMRFGSEVADAGDMTGDGKNDIAVGAPFDDVNGIDAGFVRVFSGANGTVLFTRRPAFGASTGDRYGHALATCGDWNGDGKAELAVGAPEDGAGNGGTGYVEILTGSSGSLLAVLTGANPGDRFGDDLAGGSDIGGDGIADLVVGIPGNDNFATDAGQALAFSGATQAPAMNFFGTTGGAGFGTSVGMIGDLDLDSVDDLVIGQESNDRSVGLFSAVNGALLVLIHGPSGATGFGRVVASAGDANNDRHPDVIIGAPLDFSSGAARGSAIVYSGLADSLGPAAIGGIVDGSGDPIDMLKVLGSAGGELRNIGVSAGAPFSLSFDQSGIMSGDVFAIFGYVGVPGIEEEVFIDPIGSLVFTPGLLIADPPGYFTLVSAIPGVPGLMGANPLPWSQSFAPLGIAPFQITLQGVVYRTSPAPAAFKTSNGLIISFVP